LSPESEQGWRSGKLGDLLPIKYGKSLPKHVRDLSGSVPVFGSSGRVGAHSEALTNGPALIVGRKGSVGSVYYSESPCWPIDTVYYTEALEGQYLRYYKYLLDSLRLVQLDKSTAVPGLSRDDYNALTVTIAPPDEQRRIVAELEKQFSHLDEAVANLKRVKANLNRYKAAVLKSAVEGALAGDRTGWRAARLGDIAISVRNGISLKPEGESGTRILRISAVRPMALDLDDVRFLAQPHANFEPFRLAAGDVLFTRYNGSVDLVGVCAAVPELTELMVYPDKLIRVRVPSEVLLPAFLVISVSTGEARSFIESRIRTTAGQAGVAGADVKAIPLWVPPIEEQHRIVAEVDRSLSIVRDVDAEVDANLKRSSALRQAALATAFSTVGAREASQ
jgi:type I restriction enzyme, S subunit